MRGQRDIVTDQGFTGQRVLRATPDGQGGTVIEILKRVEGAKHDRRLVVIALDAKQSLALARVLRAR